MENSIENENEFCDKCKDADVIGSDIQYDCKTMIDFDILKYLDSENAENDNIRIVNQKMDHKCYKCYLENNAFYKCITCSQFATHRCIKSDFLGSGFVFERSFIVNMQKNRKGTKPIAYNPKQGYIIGIGFDKIYVCHSKVKKGSYCDACFSQLDKLQIENFKIPYEFMNKLGYLKNYSKKTFRKHGNRYFNGQKIYNIDTFATKHNYCHSCRLRHFDADSDVNHRTCYDIRKHKKFGKRFMDYNLQDIIVT